MVSDGVGLLGTDWEIRDDEFGLGMFKDGTSIAVTGWVWEKY